MFELYRLTNDAPFLQVRLLFQIQLLKYVGSLPCRWCCEVSCRVAKAAFSSFCLPLLYLWWLSPASAISWLNITSASFSLNISCC